MGHKVLVHCHAGMGRTGLTIGCYMLYSREYKDVQKIVDLIQGKRKQAFRNSTQRGFIDIFAQLIDELSMLFPKEAENKQPLTDYLSKQNYLLHGMKRKKLRNCPIVIAESCERIWLLFKRGLLSASAVANAIVGFPQNDIEISLSKLKDSLNKWDWEKLYSCEDIYVIVQLMFDFLDNLSLPCVDWDHVPHKPGEKLDFSKCETEIMRSLAKICRIIMNEEVDIKLQETALYRISVSLLGLKKRESKCFLNRSLIAWDFENNELIERMKEFIETLLHQEGITTPAKDSTRSDKNSMELSPGMPVTPSTANLQKLVNKNARNIGIDQYNQLSVGLSKLTDEEKLPFFSKFDQLVKEVEQKSSLRMGSISFTPETSPSKMTLLNPVKSTFLNATSTVIPQEKKDPL